MRPINISWLRPWQLAAAIVSLGLATPVAGGPRPVTPQEPSAAACAPGWDIGDMRFSLGGQYRLMANGANAEFHQSSIPDDPAARSFANQRLRTWFNITDRARCRYGAYVQAEIGHVISGDGLEFPKTFGSSGDEVGIELRRGYLWFKPTDNSLVRAGVLDWQDRFGERPTFSDPLWAVDRYDSSRAPLANSVWDFNVSGIVFEATARDRWHYSLGTMVLQQGDQTLGGDGGSLLFTGDVDRDVGSALVGASIYYLRDRGGYSYGGFGGPARRGPDTNESWDLWVGARAHFETGPADTAVFLILNTGQIDERGWEHTGWSAKVATDVPVGPGTLSIQSLYASGDDGADPDRSGEFRTVAQSARDNLGAQSYWSLLGLSSPRGPSDVTDLGVGLQNGGLGLFTVQAGWNQPVTDTVALYLAAGWLRSAESRQPSASSAIGTEMLAELHWQMADALALDVGGSSLLTGDGYRLAPGRGAPANLYELYARWQLEF